MNLEEAVDILCKMTHRDTDEPPTPEEVAHVKEAMDWTFAKGERGREALGDTRVMAKVFHLMIHMAEMNHNPDQMPIKMAASISPGQLAAFLGITVFVLLDEMGYKPVSLGGENTKADEADDARLNIFEKWMKDRGERPQ